MLFGDWWNEDDVGDCIDVRTWYSFAADGSVWNRQIDHNACSGNRLIDEVVGAYSLDGRRLEIRLHGIGSERPFDMSTPTMAVAQRTELMTIAIGAAPMVVGRAPQIFLDGRALTSSDGTTFESMRGTLMTSAGNDVVFRQLIAVALQLNPGLPLAASDHTTVQVQADLTAFDSAHDSAERTATVTVEYAATIREELGWLRILPDALDGLEGQAAIDAWHQVLDDNDVTSQPEWARRLLDAEFYPSQRFQAGDIVLLSSSLPEWGRWTRSEQPPPIL